MNRFLLIILLVFATNHCFSKELVISGTIKNGENHTMTLTFGPDPITSSKENVNLKLDEKGMFKVQYHINGPSFVFFIIDKNYKYTGRFTAFPNDSIFVSGDLKNLTGTLKYSGTNRNYDKYLDLLFMGSNYVYNLSFPDTSKIDWEKISINLNTITNKRLTSLDSLSKIGLLSTTESLLAWGQIKYIKYIDLISLLAKAQKRFDQKLFTKYYIYDIQNDSIALISSNYSIYIDNFIVSLYGINKGITNTGNSYDFRLIKGYYEEGLNHLEGLTRDVFLTRQMYNGIQHGSPDIEDLYIRYQTDCKRDFLKEFVKSEYKLFQIIKTKNDNLNYKIITNPPEDFTRFLNDYKDRVLFIEFWGSWCSPCIKSIPQIQELSAKINNKDFQIIHVAERDNYQNLEFAIKKYNIDGVHILLTDKTEKTWKNEINFYTVPYYAIINREGKIIEHGILSLEFESESEKIKTIIERSLK
jgi:thiol-disulfide isomerase/thioredoxin